MENLNRTKSNSLKAVQESLGVHGALDLQNAIGQLKSLEGHCQSMIDEKDPVCIWRADCDAIRIGIKALEMIIAGGLEKDAARQ